MESREIFWGISHAGLIGFYAVGLSAIALFLFGFYRHVAKYARGRALLVPMSPVTGVQRMLSDVLSHRMVRRRDKAAGWAHAGIFAGYVLGFIATSLIFLETDILKPLFDITFFKGRFYLLFSGILDLGHLALIVGLVYMIWRRWGLHPAKLDYVRHYRGEDSPRPSALGWRREDWIFVVSLLLIELSGFAQEAAGQIVDKPAWGAWSPVGYTLANIFTSLGMTDAGAASLRAANWWMHGILALSFTAAIPWYKAKHVIAVLGSLSLRDDKPLRRLPKEPEDGTGIATIADFTWKDMLNFDACTKCGRCHEACPARTAGYPLSPRDLILDLREYNEEVQGCPGAKPLIGGVIEPQTLWACRSCGACQEICPVGIEHPALIVRMRRQLIEQGEMDPLLRTTLKAIGDTGNSFGEASRKRSAWTQALEFKVKDIRETMADTLWFVGDFAAFDPRNQKVSQTVARLFKAADFDFGLLHEAEQTAGNDVRRTGEEGLFEDLVGRNLETFAAAKPFSRIVTTDPHSFNTLRNEYPQFGKVAPVTHYSEVLLDLLQSGKLKVKTPLAKRVTYHDPCHLGRLNGVYDAPREVLRLIGCEIVEMPRNRDNSFCCGAGGGRIWIPDQPGTQKPSENRMHEAVQQTGAEIFVTSCPKDLTMFEDARKTSGHEKDIVVKDLAELVAEAIDLKSLSLKDVPPLAERITEAVAVRIADVVAERLDKVLAARFGVLSQMPALQAAAPAALAAPVTAVEAATVEARLEETPPTAAPVAAARTAITLKPMDWDNPAPLTAAALDGWDIPPRDGPRILVMVKHVAKLGDDHQFTDDHRDILPQYLDFSLNEWDDCALEEAILAIERAGKGEVVAVTVGPEDADASLLKALAKGATRAVRVWHDDLVGADPMTIARVLAGVAAREQPDLILTGAQSSDHGYGATGTALARILGVPHAAVVIAMEWDGAASLKITREVEGGTRHSFTMASPAVIAVQTGINVPRYATMRMVKQAKQKPLAVVDGAGAQDGSGGFAVRRMYKPQFEKAQMLSGSAADIAKFIMSVVREKMGG